MRSILAIVAILTLSSCGGGGGRVTGDIGTACMAAGRSSANPALCGCVQQVANQTLSGQEQSRAAEFFAEPDRAQEIRTSDRPADERFWARYRAFADSARALCG